MQLRWIAHVRGSCFHAAELVAKNMPLVDAKVRDALAEPTAFIMQSVEIARVNPDLFWRHLVPLSCGVGNVSQLAEVVTRKAATLDRRETLLHALESDLRQCELAYTKCYTGLAEELTTRGGPLKSQFDARGPGMLKRIGELTDPSLLAERADVFLIQPALGGAAVSHLPYNNVRIEAMLANPDDSLPEVVRLIWTLAQLQLDIPMHGEHVLAERLPGIAKLAMLPPTLLAAAHVELVQESPDLLAHAMRAWKLDDVLDSLSTDAATLQSWWDTYTETKPPIAIALRALDQIVG
jgi:hypothetical protein